MQINFARQVTSVSCTCLNSKSKNCKHVAALIHFINIEKSESKTSFQQEWGKPSARQFAKEKYCKGKYICEIAPPPTKNIITNPMKVNIQELQSPSALRTILLESNKDENQRTVESVMLNLLNRVERKLKLDDEMDFYRSCLNSIFSFCNSNKIYKSNYKLLPQIRIYYEKNIVLSEEEIIKLCINTIEQSSCQIWLDGRFPRISGSKKAYSIQSRSRKSEMALVNEMLNPKKIETSATIYGIKNEEKARKEYEQNYLVKVKKIGLVVSLQQPWLCVSPDGLVLRNNQVIKLLEIKCPATCSKLSIIDEINQKSNVKYIKIVNGKAELTRSHQYFCQIQLQLYICGLQECDLYIYSQMKSLCITIYRSEEYIQNMVQKCENFYFHFFLPALYEKQIKKNSDVNNNQKLGNKRTFKAMDITNII